MKESFVEEKLEKKEMEESNEQIKEKKENSKTEIKKQEKKPKPKKENEEKFKHSEQVSEEVKKEMNINEEKKKRKWVAPVIAIIVIALIGLFVSTIFAIANINNEKIISGISIMGVDVSGLTKEEAKAKLDMIYSEKKENEINIKYQEYESSLNPTLMEANFDTEKAANEAYMIGKGDNIFINNYDILLTLINKKNIDVEMTLNEEVTKQLIQDIGLNLPGIVIEPSYAVEGDNLVITKGTEGIKIDTEKLLEQVKNILKDINKFDGFLEIPVINKVPDEINVDKIHEEVYKEVKDAYYTKDPFTIYPEVIGIDFNVDEAKAALAAEDKQEYIIKLTITKPKVTVNQIGSEAFPDLLGTWNTRYDVTAVDRTTNLKLACQKINGKVLLAGETFSYNQTLGPRTAAAGYKNAAVYEAGQVVQGIGGGICQISSTLYNAVLRANLEIVERRNHQFVTSYLPAGRDATVAYGLIDFRFKNNRKYPVKIVASCQSGIATVSVFGIKEEKEYEINFDTRPVATIPFTTKYVDDASLAPGQEVIKQKGANGIKTETYIIKSLNGKVVSKSLLSKDTYDAMTRIIHRGVTKTTTPKQNTQTQTPPVETKPNTPTTPSKDEKPTTPSTQTESTTDKNKNEIN